MRGAMARGRRKMIVATIDARMIGGALNLRERYHRYEYIR